MPGLSLVAMPAVLGMLSIFSVLPFPSLFPFPLFLLRVGFKTLVMDVSLFELSVGQQDLASQILILSIAAAWKNAVHFFEEEVAIRMRPAEVASYIFPADKIVCFTNWSRASLLSRRVLECS